MVFVVKARLAVPLEHTNTDENYDDDDEDDDGDVLTFSPFPEVWPVVTKQA